MTTRKGMQEFILHFGRYAFWTLLAILTEFIIMKLNNSVSLDPQVVAVIVAILAQVDSWIHNNKHISANGLAPF